MSTKIYKNGDISISNRVEINPTIVTYNDGTTREYDFVGEFTSSSFNSIDDKYSIFSIELGEDVTSIGEGAFYNQQFDEVIIPSSVETIGKNAFKRCTMLNEVRIQNGVKSIGVCAFEGCEHLSGIDIPSSVKTIGMGAFFDCETMSSVYLHEGLETIGASAFNCCYELSSITIPNSVTSVGSSAFEECDSLSSITYPPGLSGYPWGAPNFIEEEPEEDE